MKREDDVLNEKNRNHQTKNPNRESPSRTVSATGPDEGRVRFEVWGEEIIEKKVMLSGNSGRIYLPPSWVGRSVKIIRIG